MEFVVLLFESNDLAVKSIKEIGLCLWKMAEFLLYLVNGYLRFDDRFEVTFQRRVVLVFERNSLVKITVGKDMHSSLDISLQLLDQFFSYVFIPIHDVFQYLA